MSGPGATKLERRIRIAAIFVVAGLAIEAGSLVRHSPGGFMAFATLGIGCIVAGALLFLVSLVTVKD